MRRVIVLRAENETATTKISAKIQCKVGELMMDEMERRVSYLTDRLVDILREEYHYTSIKIIR